MMKHICIARSSILWFLISRDLCILVAHRLASAGVVWSCVGLALAKGSPCQQPLSFLIGLLLAFKQRHQGRSRQWSNLGQQPVQHTNTGKLDHPGKESRLHGPTQSTSVLIRHSRACKQGRRRVIKREYRIGLVIGLLPLAVAQWHCPVNQWRFP
jgi:hypothetical protein